KSVYADDAYTADPAIFELGVPVLGICYGMQLLTQMLGGEVVPSDEKEFGCTEININTESALFKGLSEMETVLMSHSEKLTRIPEAFEQIAQTALCKYAGIRHNEKDIYGVQFHPESKHSVNGDTFLKNFIRDIAGCHGEWSMDNFIDIEVEEIREEVGNSKVMCAMSGGVESAVTAVMMHKASDDQL